MATVIITGGSMGIGRALALAWARRKATVILSARGEDALRAVSAEVEAAGGRALPIVGDVTDEAHQQALVDRAAAEGGLDVLVNNAGRGYYAPALRVDIDTMRRVFELNVFAPLRLAQLAGPQLEKSRGAIVMMSSIAGVVAAPNYTAYSSSKFALEAIAMSMRSELAKKNIRVIVIRPGPVSTPFRVNAERAEGVVSDDAPNRKAQSADDVADLTLRAVDRGAHVFETSAYVRFASAATRIVPPAVRMVLRRMAPK